MTKRPTISTRLLYQALVFAEQDRASYAAADPGEYGKEAARLAIKFRKTRHKLFGRSVLEEAIASSRAVSISDLREEKE